MPKKQLNLGELADIRAGHSFRSKIEHDPRRGTVPVLQIRDITGGGALCSDQLPCLQWPTAAVPPYLQAGDIILPARGDHYNAVMAPEGVPVVASSQLFVLTSRSSAALPEYLCWYLNQPRAQNYFLSSRAGTSIPMLNKRALGALPVQLPSLETQHQLLALQQQWQRERQLTQQLLDNRERMLQGVFAKLLES